MDRENSDQRVAWMLALVHHWYGQPDNHEQPHTRLSAPRHITAVAGQFDTPADSDNDPVAALAGAVATLALGCAKYRAIFLVFALLIAQTRAPRFRHPVSAESLYQCTSRAFSVLPGLFSWLCQISHLLTGKSLFFGSLRVSVPLWFNCPLLAS